MKRLFFLLFLLLPLICFSAKSNFRDSDSSAANPAPSINERPQNVADILDTSKISFQLELSLIVVIFGAVTIFLETYLAAIKIIHSEHIVKCIILTLIITGSLLLITAGYSSNQINGITGLMGSIAGYLLAKTNFKKSSKSESNENSKVDG